MKKTSRLLERRAGLAGMVIASIALLPHCSDPIPSWLRDKGDAGAPAAGEAGVGSDGGSPSGDAGGGGISEHGAGVAGTPPGSAGDDSGGDGATSSGGQGAVGAGGADGGAQGGTTDAGRAGSGGVSQPGSGGTSQGGKGGTTQGGSAGTSGQAGSAGEPSGPRPDFILGADISSVQEAIDQGAVYLDTDGVAKPVLDIFKAHGFNYVRLRTFVEPMNLYGYANPNGDSAFQRAEPYCDRDHTVEFGKMVKDAGMGFLLDLHYSDNWADPGKQIIPQSWRGVETIEELGEIVKTYTTEVVQALVDAGARPDIVQLGNEITPGMLMHVPGPGTTADQWGNLSNQVLNDVNGSTLSWARLSLLLKKATDGVRAVDPDIKIMLHIANTENASAARGWVNAARTFGVEFDILGLSCYPTWHGQPSVWENTFRLLANSFPELSFVIAEYSLERRRANEIMRDLPGNRGLGTFIWEPAQTGNWGPALFSYSGTGYSANAEDFAEFERIRDDFGME